MRDMCFSALSKYDDIDLEMFENQMPVLLRSIKRDKIWDESGQLGLCQQPSAALLAYRPLALANYEGRKIREPHEASLQGRI